MKRVPPSWEERDPDYPREGDSWYLKGPPPVHKVYSGGIVWETPYGASPGESEVPILAPSITQIEFPIALSTDDVTVGKNASVYPPTGSVIRSTTGTEVETYRSYLAGTNSYYVYSGLLKFDTSSLPDAANLQSVVLRAHVSQIGSPDSRNFRGESYAWSGVDADWTSDGAGGITAFDVPISSLTPNALNDIPVSSGTVSVTGTTSYRLHVTGGQPTGHNFVYLYSFDDTTHAEPKLIVTYTV